MAWPGTALLRRLFLTNYKPRPQEWGFLERAETQESSAARVTVAVPDTKEAARFFGVPLSRRGLQPVFVRVLNTGKSALRLQPQAIDANYFTPLEAAGINHFSLLKRFSGFGLFAWLIMPLVFLVLPLKLFTAYFANRRMDELFRANAFRLRPIEPGTTAEGFVFSKLDSGTKEVHVRMHKMGEVSRDALAPAVEFTFLIPIPGIAVDYHRRDFEALVPSDTVEDLHDVPVLTARLEAMPAATTNRRGTGTGDPVNLVVLGTFEDLIGAFGGRWDETETITIKTCWKTTKAFLFGSEYRYSPVSALYLFGRGQDLALQRSRRSINERMHLRLWLTPMRFHRKPVWVGQISRDIGVRFTTKTLNLTTHRVDPDVDEARDYVFEDLLEAERIEAAGYVKGVGECTMEKPRRNLTGDPYHTDGKRAVILVSAGKVKTRFLSWG